MRYSDIKTGYIYFADLEPIRKYEFGGKHLSIVLNKGHDKKTVTVVSLTSKSSGLGQNKINAGVINSLPKRLVQDQYGNFVNTYVVLDQVRTVSASRILPLKDGVKKDGTDNTVECQLDDSLFSVVVRELTDLRISNLDFDQVGDYHKNSFFDYCVKKMVDLAYDIIKGIGDISEKTNQIVYYHSNALAIENNFKIETYVTAADFSNQIPEKINEIILKQVV